MTVIAAELNKMRLVPDDDADDEGSLLEVEARILRMLGLSWWILLLLLLLLGLNLRCGGGDFEENDDIGTKS